jgi:hypothetical protein
MEEGQCRSYHFGQESIKNENGIGGSCTNGPPGLQASYPDRDCMVTVREFVQCGSATDLETKVTSNGLNINWYTPLIATNGQNGIAQNNGTCTTAKIVLDVLCTGNCPINKCHHGGTLNKQACSCTCPYPYTGNSCDLCGLKEKDCQHGTSLVGNSNQCTCVPKKDTKQPFVWGGVTGETCLLNSETACINGGTLDTKSCSCINCNEPWSGHSCNTCTLDGSKCQQGSSFNIKTCKCDINCPTWGTFCDRCPKGIGSIECSGRGQCGDNGQCQCDASLWSGDACEHKMITSTCSIREYSDVTTFHGSKSLIVY